MAVLQHMPNGLLNSYTVTWVENGGTPAPDDLTGVAALPATTSSDNENRLRIRRMVL